MRNLTRRKLLATAGVGALGVAGAAALGGCGDTQIVEVEKVVTVEVEKVVEKIVTQEAMPAQIERTEIVFWDWWSPSANVINEVWFDWLKENYSKEHPGGSYRLQVVPFGELPVKFQAAVASGDVPDVIHFSNSWSWDFFRFGALRPLNDLAKTRPDIDIDAHFPVTAFYAVHKGDLVGIPFEGPDSEITMYNTDMFTEAGLDPDPNVVKNWTWDDFDEAAARLTMRSGDEIDRGGYLVKVPDPRHFAVWMYTQNGSLYTELHDGFDINNEKGLNVFNHLLKLLYEDKVSLPLVQGRNNMNEFLTSKTAMFQAGTWNVGSIEGDVPGFPFDIMPYPAHPDGGSPAVATWMNMLGIPTKAEKNLDQAWEFIAWYTDMERSLKRLQLQNKTSTLLAFYETPEWKISVANLPQLQRIVDVAEVGGERPGRARTELEPAIRPFWEAVMLQEMSPEEGLQQITDTVKPILEESSKVET